MRVLLALSLLGLLGACAVQPSSGERALLSRSGPHSARVQADVQAILQGMEHARSSDERVARYGR